jgi:hypothetical protein
MPKGEPMVDETSWPVTSGVVKSLRGALSLVPPDKVRTRKSSAVLVSFWNISKSSKANGELLVSSGPAIVFSTTRSQSRSAKAPGSRGFRRILIKSLRKAERG